MSCLPCCRAVGSTGLWATSQLLASSPAASSGSSSSKTKEGSAQEEQARAVDPACSCWAEEVLAACLTRVRTAGAAASSSAAAFATGPDAGPAALQAALLTDLLLLLHFAGAGIQCAAPAGAAAKEAGGGARAGTAELRQAQVQQVDPWVWQLLEGALGDPGHSLRALLSDPPELLAPLARELAARLVLAGLLDDQLQRLRDGCRLSLWQSVGAHNAASLQHQQAWGSADGSQGLGAGNGMAQPMQQDSGNSTSDLLDRAVSQVLAQQQQPNDPVNGRCGAVLGLCGVVGLAGLHGLGGLPRHSCALQELLQTVENRIELVR